MRYGTRIWSLLLMVLALLVSCWSEPAQPARKVVGGRLVSASASADVLRVEADGARAEVLARGEYLVSHAAACAACHSPRRPDRSIDRDRWLSGIDCMIDAAPNDPHAGCLSTRNLTNHETGLKNRTDLEIKNMFMRGVRPDGRALHPFMPYQTFANMRERDADAIVAYLRTVKGVDHQVRRNQPPYLAPEQPAPPIPQAAIPEPRADYTNREAALRGRYLAAEIGTCVTCHTPNDANGALDLARVFQGGATWSRELMGLPPFFPAVIYSANLTPHRTGIAEYSVADVVRAVKFGEDKNQGGERLCPPMPAGPKGTFGGIADADAADIGHYLLSIPAVEHVIPQDCSTSAPAQHANAGKPPGPT